MIGLAQAGRSEVEGLKKSATETPGASPWAFLFAAPAARAAGGFLRAVLRLN